MVALLWRVLLICCFGHENIDYQIYDKKIVKLNENELHFHC